MSYGTIFIDLESRRPVGLLKSRKHIHVTEWLKEHPEIELITRDGSKTYAKAVTEASSTILQVSDRWHILHQLFEAIKKTVVGLIPEKWTPNLTDKTVSVNEEVNVPLRKNDDYRIQNEDKRWDRIQRVQSLYSQGYTVTAIKSKLQISRGTVYADLRQKEKPNHQRASPFDRVRPLIHSLLQERQTAKQIEQACRLEGFTGSQSTLNTIIAEERRLTAGGKKKSFSFRQKIIQVIWDFEKGEHLERILQLHPNLLETFPKIRELDELVQSFRNLFKEKEVGNLANWIKNYDQHENPIILAFIRGIKQDLNAVMLSIQKPWSNGPVEGHVNRLKTIKRMMYGRAGFDVLKNRVLYQW